MRRVGYVAQRLIWVLKGGEDCGVAHQSIYERQNLRRLLAWFKKRILTVNGAECHLNGIKMGGWRCSLEKGRSTSEVAGMDKKIDRSSGSTLLVAPPRSGLR